MLKKIPEPVVAVFFGLTGSGKSYLAHRWALKHNLYYLNSDEVRKQIAGVARESRHHVPFNQGLYSPEMTARTYREMVDRGVRRSAEGGCAGVVLDGSFGKDEQRDQVVAAFTASVAIFFIHCHCSEAVTRHRFTLRAEDDQAVSDGRWEIYLGQKRSFSVPRRISGARVISLDTDNAVEVLIDEVDEAISNRSARG